MRSLGISLRPEGFTYALVEGTGKKHALKAAGGEDCFGRGQDASADLGRAIASSLKRVGKIDKAVLSLPSTGAVLREISLPFNERDKVEQVLKFEIESDLYHIDVEEVVCDFLELHDERATTNLLVGALPKAHVGAALKVAEQGGVDAAVADLDLGSLFTALCSLPKSEDSGVEAYLYVGGLGSLLLITSEGDLRAARSIRLGWKELTRDFEVEMSLAEEELSEPGEVSADTPEGESTDDEGQGATEEGEGELEGPLFGADGSLLNSFDLESALERATSEAKSSFLHRMANEVRRAMAVVTGLQVEHLYLLGARVQGMESALSERLGVDAAPLDLGVEDELGAAPDPLAYGAALRGLGCEGSPMDFRREEFRYTQGLERIQGPLTYALVGILAFCLADMAINVRQARVIARDLWSLENPRSLLSRAAAKVERLNEALPPDPPGEWVIASSYEATEIAPEARMSNLRGRVRRAADALDQLVGEGGISMPQSCLEAWRLFSTVLDEEMSRYPDRWMLESLDFTSMDAKLTGRSPLPAHVKVIFGVSVHGVELAPTAQLEAIQSAFQAQPWVVGDVSLQAPIGPADVDNARYAMMEVLISTEKGKEAGI